jgi:protein O-GlcNAc transferase
LSNPEAFIKLTWIFEQQENYQAIVDLYGQYGNVLLNTDVSEFEKERSLLQWSYALSRMNQNLVAIDLLTQAFELFPFFFRVGYNLVALLDSVGKYEEEEIILEKNVIAEHRFLFETKGKSIVKVPRPRHRAIVVLYCYEYGQTWWDEWGPSSLKKGLGGSEEAVLFLSRELSQLGYWVEIYGNPSVEDQGKDEYGVLWYPHYAFNHNDQDVDIFIAWRYYISLLLGQSARLRYFWIHDIPSANLLQSQKILPLAHGILCVSNFQAQQFTKEVDKWASRLFVTSNGLDPKYFRDGPNFLTHFVYGSSPNRGLYHILKAWPRIRAFIPEAQLTVYYGFTPAFLRWARRKMPSFETWKKEMDNMLTQPGVKYIGLVDHEELAKGYANAGFSLYPTTFSETSCVSLMKAMANGAIPITSRYVASALSETCDEFDLGPSTPVQSEQELVAPNSQWITSWIENIVMAVQNVQETQALRKKMKEFARKRYQWSNVALQWHGIFRRGLASSSTTTTITS